MASRVLAAPYSHDTIWPRNAKNSSTLLTMALERVMLKTRVEALNLASGAMSLKLLAVVLSQTHIIFSFSSHKRKSTHFGARRLISCVYARFGLYFSCNES